MRIFGASGTELFAEDATGSPLQLLSFQGDRDSPLTDPNTPLNVQPVGQTGFGDPVFSDEFQGAWNASKWIPWYPDTDFWNATVPGGHKTNTNEPQGYDETGITAIPGGGVRFTLHESNHAVPELDFTSGMLCSYPSFNPVYGYFEARMKLANARGAWPAFWMDPTDMDWPPEIDWMENWGDNSFNTETSHTFHFPRPTPGGFSGTDHEYSEDVGNNFHVFGGLWEPGRLRWYVDGELVKDLVSEYVPAKEMYLICNLAGNKDQIPNVIENAPFSIDVDYIRSWALPE